MAKQDTKKYIPDLLPLGTIVEKVKFNKETGEYIGIKIMEYGEFKNMKKQTGFIYKCFQKGFSQFDKIK